MKYIKTILLLIALLCYPSVPSAEKIMLQWDGVEDVDGYYIYQAIRAGDPPEHAFDYDQPVTTDDYPDGKIPQNVNQITVDLPGIESSDAKYMFVARAFRDDEQSENSNEVSYVVSLIPPLPAGELAGGYNKGAGIISLSWQQPGDEPEWRQPVSHWIIYYRIDAGGWIPIGRIDSGNELTLEAPFSAVAEGEQKTVEFAIVTYRRSGIYSANSDILAIDIDRRGVPPVQNLKISIEIPVI
ncbi:MAG: hypothetical protein KJP07_23315 [Desulfatitalea sp.]|nr:hypothetical protein [Desulfatitalea sp.]